MPETTLANPVGVEVLLLEKVMEEIEREQPLTFVQSTLMATFSSQPFGTSEIDVRALANLSLLDLVANFDPKLSGQVIPEAPTSFPLPTVIRGLIEEGEP